ncbi:MAG: response regulator [Holosporales bacterium]|jgi:two-component system phosphate regulon response regulator OmpR|nr:response regulator [Holosporales bacterium]
MHGQVTVLVVDDDPQLRELLKEFLKRNGFIVYLADNVDTAQSLLEREVFSAIVLDIMLPGKTGIEWTREIKEQGIATPVLLLTARALPQERVSGLEAGADDYLSKPFEPQELLLRLRNLIARTPPKLPSYVVTLGPRTIDLRTGRILFGTQESFLSSTELALLRSFVARTGEPLSRETLCKLSGGCISERSVDVQIARLRQKIEEDSSCPRFIQTVRHKGYVLWASESV